MSEQIVTSPDDSTWRSNGPNRGYDHSRDRILLPSADEIAFFSAEQLQLMAEQLELVENPADFIKSIGETSLKRVGVRTVWEETNLRAMGVLPLRGDTPLVEEYAELAGDPERIHELLQWFSEYTAAFESTEGTVLGLDGTVQNEEFIGERAALKPSDGLKGLAIEGGTAIQHGNWDESLFLEEAMKKGLDRARSRYAITRWERPSALRPGRHKISEVYDDSGISFDVVRERPYADVNGRVHVIKRSVSRVIPNYHTVNDEQIKSVLNYMAQLQAKEGTRDTVHLNAGARELMNNYSRIIHEHPRPDRDAPYFVVPDSMSFIFRRPPKKV